MTNSVKTLVCVFILFVTPIYVLAQIDSLNVIEYQYQFWPQHSKGFKSIHKEKLFTDGKNFEIEISKPKVLSSTMFRSSQNIGTRNIMGKLQDSVIFSFYGKRNQYDPIVTRDRLPSFNWKIYNRESKEILGYKTLRATVAFRGTDFEAYFAPELNISIGPFKFKGLPGAILEINSIDNDHHWKVISIKRIPNGDHYLYHDYSSFSDVISQEQFVDDLWQKYTDEYVSLENQKYIISKTKEEYASIHRDTLIPDFMILRSGAVEKLYEWEHKKRDSLMNILRDRIKN